MRLLVLLLASWPVAAQVAEWYRSVDRLTWVVDDLARVTRGWEKTGLLQIEHRGDFELPLTFRGKPATARVRMASGFFGDVRVEWIQPLDGGNAFAEYRKKHGSGVFSLVHRMPTLDAFHREIERLRGLGVEVLQSGEYATDAGAIHYAYLDTEPEGKYLLGLIHLPDGVAERAAEVTPDRKIIQFAFTAHDLKPVSAYWAKLGLGAMAFNPANLSEVEYGGKPIQIRQIIGWQRGRKTVYEWIQPVTSPNVFDDHMKARGEGVQHLALNQVPDMDRAVGEWTRGGLRVSQAGRWGEKGKPGSGRFAYIDTEEMGGVTTELLWNFR